MNKFVLIACEESQQITKRMRALGIECYSCDILAESGGHPEWHICGDVSSLLQGEVSFRTSDGVAHRVPKWDMIIAHPPCTYLTVTGNKWYFPDSYITLNRQGKHEEIERIIEERKKARELAVQFFEMFVNADCERIAIENPVGIMNTRYRTPDQIIQPYEFGEPVSKKTCLWLKGLPKLRPTNIVEPAPRIRFASGKSMDPWYAKGFRLSPDERSRLRSKTFDGIADAITEQWGKII